MSSGHIVKSYDEELEAVRNTIVEMGGLAESQLEAAVRALTERNTELALKTIEGDKVVDELEHSVDNMAIRMLALRSPVADDLRLVISALKIASVLERVADYAANIAKRDAELAYDVWVRDQEVDQLYNSMFRELLTFMMEDPRSITSCTHLIFMAKNIERMGDHMTNIAEIIIYQVNGEMPREPRPKGDKTSVTMIENDGSEST